MSAIAAEPLELAVSGPRSKPGRCSAAGPEGERRRRRGCPSLRLLLSLVARGIDHSPYGALVAVDRFFATYEINLFSLQKCALETWGAMNGLEWIEWLAASWTL